MLGFLPEEILAALKFVNEKFLTEIRLRRGQPVIIEYRGEYNYLTPLGASRSEKDAVICGDTSEILNSAMGGNVFSYAEQLKNGFITVSHGVRIGVAGEYVTEGGKVVCITSVTSLNIRVPHDVRGCAESVYNCIYKDNDAMPSALIFSRPGLGKTTMLRDLAVSIGGRKRVNVLVFDERREISAVNAEGYGYNLGAYVDVVRCSDKLSSIKSAIRAMKPQVIITDELYGENDVSAVKYARDCGIAIIASSHIVDRDLLLKMPFDYYIGLRAIGKEPVIYDKNFNSRGDSRSDDGNRGVDFGG